MNYGEGRQLSDRMSELGHEAVGSAEEADIVVLNTCTVVETTEKKMIKRMSDLRKAGKHVIVTGCMAKAQPSRVIIRLPGSIMLPPEEYDLFSGLVEDRYGRGASAPAAKEEMFCIIPIAQGCLGDCAYCITKYARGVLRSYPEENILAEFADMVAHGAREIQITAQDTACYGRDTGTDLPSLLRSILKTDGDYRIRIGMMNPNALEPILDDLLDAMDDPRVYRFFHIPVQSGSDAILASMRRHYTADKFMSIIGRIRARYPDASIATDMIVGFPGETDADHRMSLDLIKKLRADTVNITRFSVRPGTDAVGMTQVHGRIVAERSAEMTEVKNATEYDVNSGLVGCRYRVLVTENGKPGTVIARTDNYRPVAIDCTVPLGTFAETEITDCAATYLHGKIL